MTQESASLNLSPHSIEAEEAVLGAVLIEPESIFDIRPLLGGNDFFLVQHKWIWESFLAIADRSQAIDYISVISELRNCNQLDQIGGPGRITFLINNTPTHLHVTTYARIVKVASIRRQLLTAAGEIAKLALEEDAEIEDILSRCQQKIFSVSDSFQDNSLIHIRNAASIYYDQIEFLSNNPTEFSGVTTGYESMDKAVFGFGPDQLIILAARPGMGKSGFLLCQALRAARMGKRIAIFSLEMSTRQLMQRFYSAETHINGDTLRRGTLDTQQWGKFTEGTSKLSRLPIYISDRPSRTVSQIKTAAIKLYREDGLDEIIVDHLGLIRGEGRQDNRNGELGAISWGLKELSKELSIPVVAACQLNRDLEKRVDKRPTLPDLRQSGEIEENADIVLGLYRESYYNPDTDLGNSSEMIVLKQREGDRPTIDLVWIPVFTEFREPHELKYQHVDLRQHSPNQED